MKKIIAPTALLACLFLGTAFLKAETEGQPSTDDLTGADVVNKSGETLGELKDFVLDPQSKQLQFAIVQSGGVLGMGGKSVLVPWEAFQVERNAQDNTTRVVLDATSEKLQGATEYDSEQPIRADEIFAYWGIDRNKPGASQQQEGAKPQNPGASQPEGGATNPQNPGANPGAQR